MEVKKVIIGKPGSGKSTLALHHAKSYKNNEVFKTSGNMLKSVFCFSGCSKETKLVIVDEITSIAQLEKLIFSEEIEVFSRYNEPFTINPKIILVCSSNIKLKDLPEGASFALRVEVTKCRKPIIFKSKINQ